MEIRRYSSDDLAGIIRLCAIEKWPSFGQDAARANRALTAPGVTTVVAVDDGEVVGFAQLQSDGEIQAHLSLIAVDKRHRRRGVGRDLIETALRIAGGQSVDLVTDTASDFYSRLPHFRMLGFPLFPLYTGPDREVPDLYWKDGMKVAEPEKENCG